MPTAEDDPCELSISRLIQQASARKRFVEESTTDGAASPPATDGAASPPGTDGAASPPATAQRVTVPPRQVITNEWVRYQITTIDPETVECAGGPLGWWRQIQDMYPHLAKLARMYLAVQASLAASERLFSQAGLVITDKRNRMSGETAGEHRIPSQEGSSTSCSSLL